MLVNDKGIHCLLLLEGLRTYEQAGKARERRLAKNHKREMARARRWGEVGDALAPPRLLSVAVVGIHVQRKTMQVALPP